MVLIDLWARETNTPHDCFADITWVGYCGAEAPAKARQVFAVVAAGRDAAVRLMQRTAGNGATVYGYEVDDACRNVIVAAGTATPSSTAPATAWASRCTTTASTSTT
jgi:Xaa-Pro dipeptidase